MAGELVALLDLVSTENTAEDEEGAEPVLEWQPKKVFYT